MTIKDSDNDDLDFDDDDFFDDEDLGEVEDVDEVLEEAFDSEELEDEWEDEDEDDLTEFGEVKEKKKDTTRFLVYLLAGVSIVGVVGYHFISGSQDSAAPIMAPEKERVLESTSSDTAPPENELVGFLVDPSELGETDPGKMTALVPIESTTPPMPSNVMDFEEKTAEDDKMDVLTPMPDLKDSSVNNTETADLSLTFDKEDPPKLVVEQPKEKEKPAQAIEKKTTTSKVASLLFGEDEPDNQYLDLEQTKKEPVKPMPTALEMGNNEEYQDLQDKIAKLEGLVKDLKAENRKEKEADLKKIASLNETISNLERQISKKSVTKTTTPSKTVTKKQDTMPPKTTKTATVTPVKRTVYKKKATQPRNKTLSWELRSALPGRAIVSKKGQNDIKTVEVGDFLSGIGRINSIAFIHGQWVVEGSAGKITR